MGENGLLKLNLKQTMLPMAMDIPMDILTDIPMDMAMEKGLLRLNLKQTMVPTAMDIPMDTPMESGLLKLNLKPKLMLILPSTLDTTMLDTMVLTCLTTREPTMSILTTIMLQLAAGIPLVLWFPVLANNVLFSVLQ